MIKWIVVAGLVVLLPIMAAAEEHEGEAGEPEKRQKLMVSFGYTHIPEGADDEDSDKGVFVPTVGLDYFYRVTEKWELGLMFDIEFGEYLIIDQNLNRSDSMILAAVAGYELLPSWSVLAGGGIEIEESENLPIIRLGTEYQFRPGGEWVIAPGFIVDISEEYTSWSLVLGAGMEF